MPKTPEEMYTAIAKNLPERTGKGLEEWLEIAKEAPEGTRTERIEWLMEFGLGRGQAQTVLYHARAMDIDYSDEDGLVRAMYKGRHEALFPVYEKTRDALMDKWGDVDLHVLKTYVSFNRNRQFLIMRPKGGMLVMGLALPEDHEDGRLAPAKNLGSERIKWSVAISGAEDLADYLDLVDAAYEAN
jgi:predicted transport protein